MTDVKGLTDIETQRELIRMIGDLATDDMVLVEVGVFLGSNIVYLGNRCVSRKVYPDIWAIDNWECSNISPASRDYVGVQSNFREAFEHNIRRYGLNKLVEVLQSDSLEAAAGWMDKTIDFLFLDSCHEYPFVKNELEAWLPKMKANSIIGGHDYCSSDGIRRAVKEVLGDNINLTSNKASYWKVLGRGL